MLLGHEKIEAKLVSLIQAGGDHRRIREGKNRRPPIVAGTKVESETEMSHDREEERSGGVR